MLFAALLSLVVVRTLLAGDAVLMTLALALAFACCYAAGAGIARLPGRHRAQAGAAWVAALSLLWVALLIVIPEAAYLAFPLFFLYLHVLPGAVGPITVAVATAVAVIALGLHGHFTVGGVVGPVVGAGVALLVGLGYGALEREAAEREELLTDLLATRGRLAATEHQQGVLAERARLARDIHDTVAQGLSSIQMLLHAAERADEGRPGLDHIRLARATAADGLADTRRFIRELAPPALDRGLAAALHRLGRLWERDGIHVSVTAPPEDRPLSMETQTALLRIAQGAVANAVQHAGASTIELRLTVTGGTARLDVVDDGIGFDRAVERDRAGTSDSFGLRAMSERADQLGGRLHIDSTPGRGTTITVELEVTEP
ncbi:sensor histidine kinase [Klenkia terrae]|uniref:sensor histidine kinase n=1 Tax=Klenkia terrae TaxID=1052259 RepID=UPI00360C6C73